MQERKDLGIAVENIDFALHSLPADNKPYILHLYSVQQQSKFESRD